MASDRQDYNCPMCGLSMESAELVLLHFEEEHGEESHIKKTHSSARGPLFPLGVPLQPKIRGQPPPASRNRVPRVERSASGSHNSIRGMDLESLLDIKPDSAVPPLGLQKMKFLLSRGRQPVELQMELTDHRKGFKEELWLLNRDNRERTGTTLLLIAKALTDTRLPDTHAQFLWMVYRSPWFSHLAAFLQGTQILDDTNIQYINCALSLIKIILQKMPSARNEVHPIVLVISYVVTNKECLVQYQKDALLEELHLVEFKICELASLDRTATSEHQDECEDFLQPPEKFLDISILPTVGDMKKKEEPFLRVNKIKGKYKDLEHYLDVQFRLMRQDLVAPLSLGIQEYRKKLGGQACNLKDVSDIRFYHNVHLLGPVCSRQSIAYRVRFDTRPYRGLNWQASKRFMHGSLICMSHDGFNTILFGTVSNSKPKDLAKGELEIFFEDRESLVDFDHLDVFVLVESPAFYESYRHVLQSMKVILEDGLAMSKYILDCSRNPCPPSYLDVTTQFDLSTLAVHEVDQPRLRNVPALSVSQWPGADVFRFNESQLQALKAGLTQEFALIQGPPGTGKTFVGIKIVQVLLANKSLWNLTSLGQKRPILVVCYTNHALDQFLEGIYEDAGQDILRIGGQSKSEKLEPCMLRAVRSKLMQRGVVSSSYRHQVGALYGEMKEIDCQIETCTALIRKLHSHLLKPECIESYASDLHYSQLMEYGPEKEAIMEWLGCSDKPDQIKYAPADIDDTDTEEQKSAATLETAADFVNQLRKIETPNKRQEEHMEEVRKLADAKSDWFLDPLICGKKEAKQGDWQVPRMERRRRLQYLKYNLRQSRSAMSIEEAERVQNIRTLSLEQRWRLYHYWVKLFCRNLRELSQKLAEKYHAATVRLSEIHRNQDLEVMRHVDVIGMTTTGASRYHSVLQQLNPPIIIIEEAAEVLEAHVIASLNTECKHLILIGDHKQLRPNPTVYDLARKYHLDLSLFERMVNNGIQCVTLTTQHRMRPEICELIKPIYPVLHNHEVVLRYPHVKGVKHDLFFISHTALESQNPELFSKANDHEAQFISAFCQYMLQQGYEPSQITVLTPYSGQLIILGKYMKKKVFKGVRVCIVDSFQGEENDIILLSLVRSNHENSIGFLDKENRICVALSRAKIGLYVIGNFGLLSQNDLWATSVQKLGGHCSPTLPLYCQNHPETGFDVACADDFKQCPDGGCLKICEYIMDCGHQCPMRCHPADPEHEEVKCIKPCPRLCENGHQCHRKCHEECERCHQRVQKLILTCTSSPKHTVLMECYKDTSGMPCEAPCTQRLLCGHTCVEKCNEPHTRICHIATEKSLLCGHYVTVPCHQSVEHTLCDQDCNVLLRCGHECMATCLHCLRGRIHQGCQDKCDRVLLCGHVCHERCATACPPCPEKCELYCPHKQCSHKCGEPCVPCREPCSGQCAHHKCSKQCWEPCDRPRCNERCEKALGCGHPCLGVCGEICPPLCAVCHRQSLPEHASSKIYVLLQCNHAFEMEKLDQHVDKCATQSQIHLPYCPKCKTVIQYNMRYAAVINSVRILIENAKRTTKAVNDSFERRARLKSYEELHAVSNLNASWKEILKSIDEGARLRVQQYADLETLQRFFQVIKNLSQQLNRIEGTDYYVEAAQQIEDLKSWLLRQFGKFGTSHGPQLEMEVQRLVLLIQFAELASRLGEPIQELLKPLLAGQPLQEGEMDQLKRARQRLCAMAEWANDCLSSVEDEKIKAVCVASLVQDQWFRCQYGHVSYIGESGNEAPSTCPVCTELDSTALAEALQMSLSISADNESTEEDIHS